MASAFEWVGLHVVAADGRTSQLEVQQRKGRIRGLAQFALRSTVGHLQLTMHACDCVGACFSVCFGQSTLRCTSISVAAGYRVRSRPEVCGAARLRGREKATGKARGACVFVVCLRVRFCTACGVCRPRCGRGCSAKMRALAQVVLTRRHW